MNDDSTGNDGPLSLAERARRVLDICSPPKKPDNSALLAALKQEVNRKWAVEDALLKLANSPLAATPIPTAEPTALAVLPEPVATGGSAASIREIALVDAENAALVALRKELKHEPTARQWLNYWRNGKDTEGTIKEVTGSHVVWVGKDNQIHLTALTTMNTRFGKAKKRNPFTPA